MFRYAAKRTLLSSNRVFSANLATSTAAAIPDLSAMKLDSNNSQDLYSVVKIYKKPYLVTKGDKIVLPFKLKDAEVGDLLILNEITTLGSPQYTYQCDNGIPQEVCEVLAKVVEITKEPYYEVVRRKKRCRRRKTIPVEPFQTHLMINELRLK